VLPWSRSGNFRFFVHLTLGLLYLLLLVNLTYVILKITMTNTHPTGEQIVVTNFWGAVIFIPVFSIYFSLHFLKHWRESELATAKVQKENMRSQLNSLKSQLDPHFLFNNLNILSALIDNDTQRSKKFVEKFAEVYRALLRSKSEDLTSLAEELEFIDAYMYLIRTRFEDNIQLTCNLKAEGRKRMLPPLTLQLLIENAIKHNVIQEGQPLTIHLLQLDDDYLMVSNSLNEKKEKDERIGSGLINIRNRYAYFTDKPVKILRSDTHFEVHIPLLEIEHA
jgi:LytS/YehU family sensor histidine kinase